MRATSLLLCGLLTVSTLSTAIAGTRSPDVVDDAAVFAVTDRSRAATLLEQAIPEASPRDVGAILLHAGEHRRLLGDFDAARVHFEAALTSPSRSADPRAANAGLVLVNAATQLDRQVIDQLRALPESDILATQNADRFLVLAMVAAAEGQASQFERFRAKAVSYSADAPDQAERIVSRLDGAQVAAEPTELPADYAMQNDSASDADLAEQAIAAGNSDRARRLISRLRESASTEAERREARYLERRLDSVAVNPRRLGVILPLSGRYAAVGAQVKEALEHGYINNGGTGELLIVDSGATEESAIAAAESLVFDEGVVALVGPLLSSQADAVAAASEAMRTPLIGLAQSLEPSEDHQYVFRASVSVGDQVDALVDYVVNDAGLRTLGIFAPDNDYGRGAAEAFRAAVERQGGTIAGSEFYDPASNDMTAEARRLPRVEYDGLFIPDNASRVPLASAGLAYEEFPVGIFQPEPGQKTIRLLGLNSWNNEDILTQGGSYVRNALFTELFMADDSTASSFVQAYTAATGRSPSALEAVFVDVGNLLATTHAANPQSPSAFRDALRSTTVGDPITGLTGIREGGNTAAHRLRILTITRDSISVVE